MHPLWMLLPGIVCAVAFAAFAAGLYDDAKRPPIGLPRREIALGAAAAALSSAGLAVCVAGIAAWLLS